VRGGEGEREIISTQKEIKKKRLIITKWGKRNYARGKTRNRRKAQEGTQEVDGLQPASELRKESLVKTRVDKNQSPSRRKMKDLTRLLHASVNCANFVKGEG